MFSPNTLIWVGDRLFVIVLVISTRPLLYRVEIVNGSYGLTMAHHQLQEQQP